MIIHICNKNTPDFEEWKNISSYQELLALSEPTNAVWLLNASLNWNENKQSNFYGFDIANFIRTEKKSKAPIVFYSPIPKTYFEKRSDKEIKYKILFGRGSAFLEAPFKEADLNKLAESIEPLSNVALHDVATMLCDLKGIVIDKLNHDLKFGLDNAGIDKVIGSVTPYLSELQKNEIKLNEFVINIKAATSEDDFNSIKRPFIILCYERLTGQGNKEQQEKRKEEQQEDEHKHTVLVLDDLPEEIAKAKKHLEKTFSVKTALTGKDAIRILKEDVKNDIVAVITDWRLFNDSKKKTYWQSIQGYEVLDFAAKNGIRSLFALTSQADFVVHQLRNLMGIRFSMFKKENLKTADQWKTFSDALMDACMDAVNARASKLDVFIKWKESWIRKGETQPCLKEQYIEYWNTIDKESTDNQIETETERILELLLNKEETHLIGQHELADYGFSNKVFELKKTLTLRRVWFALWFHLLDDPKFKRVSISTHTQKVYNEMIGSGSGGSIAQKLLALCIQQDKVSEKYMLPEEIEWLKRKKLL